MTEPWLVLLLLTLSPGTFPAAEPPGVAPGTLSGMVTDPDGRPVADVPIWAVVSAGQEGTTDLPPSTFSGPDGSFSIPGLQQGQIDLYACGQRHLPDSRTVWFLDEPVHLKVLPAATVRGRVVGPDGDPVADAFVLARDSSWAPVPPGRHPLREPWTPCPDADGATSDAEGRFEIGPLAPDSYHLAVYSSSGLTMEAPHPLQVAEEEVVEGIELRLHSDRSRTGSLTDSTGAPVEMGWVNVSTGEGTSRTYLTGSDGSFRYFADPGPVTFRVETEGYEALERIVEISAGDAAPVDLVVDRDEKWKTVRGRVVGPEGAPVAGAEIYLLGRGVQAQSAADGSFSLQVLLKWSSTLHVSKEGFAEGWLDLDLEAPSVVEATIRLEPGAVVTGRLFGLTPGDQGPDTRLKLDRSAGPGLDALLGADGTFRFERVPAGAWELTFEARFRSATKRVDVKPGQAEVAVDLVLPPRVLVSGRVLDGRGQPVAGAGVLASQDGDPADFGGTRGDGRFELHVPKGDVQLTASHPGFLDGQLKISAAGPPVKDLVIRLEPGEETGDPP